MTSRSKRQRGQGMTEYIIIVALVAIGAIAVVTVFGNNIRALFGNSANALAGETDSDLSGTQVQDTEKDLSNFQKVETP